MGEKRFIDDGVEPTAEEKKGALEGRIVWTVKDADKLEWSMKARLVAKDLKCRRWCGQLCICTFTRNFQIVDGSFWWQKNLNC